MSEKIHVKLSLYEMKLIKMATWHMAAAGHQAIQHAMLRSSTATKEDVEDLIDDTKAAEQLSAKFDELIRKEEGNA